MRLLVFVLVMREGGIVCHRSSVGLDLAVFRMMISSIAKHSSVIVINGITCDCT